MSTREVIQRGKLKLSRVWLLTLAFALALVMAAGLGLWHLRQDAIARQSRELELLSLALTDEVNRSLQGAIEGLNTVRSELGQHRLAVAGAESSRTLKTLADLMPMVDALWIVDPAGTVIAASDASPAPDLALFAPYLEDMQSESVAVSRPYRHPTGNQMQVAMAIPAGNVQGSSARWIFASIPTNKLLGAFSAVTPAADVRMVVFRSDGAWLAGAVSNPALVDEVHMAERLAGTRPIELRSRQDGTVRLVSVHSVPRLHLKIVLARDLEVALVGWRDAAQLTSLVVTLVLLLIAVSLYFVERANRKHHAAQLALQLQRTRASKLESLGTLAGGVAHDFNNILAAILGYGEMAQDAAPRNSPQARHLGKVLQAADRGKRLVERVLSFSRGGAKASVVFEISPVIEEVLELLTVSLRAGIPVERRLYADGAKLRGDPTQVFEAALNLCTNAMQAMPLGGMLVVEVRRARFADPQVLSHSRIGPGNYVALSVTDQGKGISHDTMEHLFEPFFTTQKAGDGSGLGLAVVHGVVAEFHGGIDVQSEPNQGACFTVYFPESVEALSSSAPGGTAVIRGRGQSILVVDDEPALVDLVSQLLADLGYVPEGITDPQEALSIVRREPEKFKAIVTDEAMPGMTGTQLIASLAEFAPRMPALLISGYGGALLAQRALAVGVSRILSKPVRRSDLAQALGELLTD